MSLIMIHYPGCNRHYFYQSGWSSPSPPSSSSPSSPSLPSSPSSSLRLKHLKLQWRSIFYLIRGATQIWKRELQPSLRNWMSMRSKQFVPTNSLHSSCADKWWWWWWWWWWWGRWWWWWWSWRNWMSMSCNLFSELIRSGTFSGSFLV